MGSKVEYVETSQMIATNFVRNSRAIGVLWGIFSICYAIIGVVAFVTPEWLGAYFASILTTIRRNGAMEPYRCYKCVFCFLSLLVFTHSSEAKHFFSVAGPVHFILRSVEPCSQTSRYGDWEFKLKQVRIPHTQHYIYSGHLKLPFYLNDTLGLRLTMASWNSVAGWRENAFVINIPNRVCSRIIDNVFKSLGEAMKISILGELLACPIWPGFYQFQNFTDNLEVAAVKQFAYGRWKAKTTVMEGQQAIGCIISIVDSIPA